MVVQLRGGDVPALQLITGYKLICERFSNIPLIGRLPWKPCVVGGGLLLTLAVFVMASAFSTFPGDRGALESVSSSQTSWLETAALAVTSLGGWAISWVLVLGVAGYLALGRHRIDALIVLLSGVPITAVLLLKEVVGRARPDYFLTGAQAGTLSFPSGHTVFAMIFGGLLIFLAGRLIEHIRIRRTIQVGVALLIVAIGASRVYLGYHWPSDVLGGYLFGSMALLALFWLRNWLALRNTGLSEAAS